MTRKLGPIGEADFRAICVKSGYVPHRPDDDCLGWDFLLEDSSEIETCARFLDQAAAALEYRVQVKSTDGRNRSFDISLKHMLRLAKLQMPVFFCALEFDETSELQAAYLIHFGEELIERTLKRVRESCAEGNRNLHHRTITINYGDEHRLNSPHYVSLPKAVRICVPHGIVAYNKWKNHLVNTAGYTDPRYITNFTIKEVEFADLVDLYLGLRDEIEINSFEGSEVRFGIPEKLVYDAIGPAKMRIDQSSNCKCVAKFRRDDFSPWLEFRTQDYAPPYHKDFPKKELRFRFASEFFDIVMHWHEDRLSFKTLLLGDERLLLSDWVAYAKLMRLLCENEGCQFQLTSNGKPILSTSIKLPGDHKYWTHVVAVTESAMRLAATAGVNEPLSISLYQLLKNSAAVLESDRLVRGETVRVSFTNPDIANEAEPVGFILTLNLMIGDRRIAGAYAIIGVPEKNGEGFGFEANRARLVRLTNLPADSEWTDQSEADLIELASNELRSEGIVPIAV